MSNKEKTITMTDTEFQNKIKQEIKNSSFEKMMEFAQQINQQNISNNFVVSQKKNLFATQFTSETVSKYLANPQKNEKSLRELSLVLTTLSPQYQQIMRYIPAISKYVPIVIPNLDKYGESYKTDKTLKIKDDYLAACNYIELMNIPHEFQRITSICARDDIFYGYIYETKDSFYIQQLDSDYCRVSTISDGVYNFQFNFEYFSKNNKLKGIESELIETYPSEFQEKYKLYLRDKTNCQWQELDEKNTICIKFLEDIPFVFPSYASLFDDLSDLTDYKSMAKQKGEIDNFKFIGMEIPKDDKEQGEDKFKVGVDTAMMFYNLALANLPKGIGAILSPMTLKELNFGSSSMSERDQVDRAENNLYTSSGISPINFGKGADNSSTVTVSNTVDSSILFKLYRQFERWLNRKMKEKFKGKFIVKLLDVTTLNEREVKKELLSLVQYGIPCKLQLAALVGISQTEERGLSFLENELLNLSEEWKPLASSHTQGNQGEVGSPKKDDTEISDSTVNNRNNDASENKKGR